MNVRLFPKARSGLHITMQHTLVVMALPVTFKQMLRKNEKETGIRNPKEKPDTNAVRV